jgi:hypothetical protein
MRRENYQKGAGDRVAVFVRDRVSNLNFFFVFFFFFFFSFLFSLSPPPLFWVLSGNVTVTSIDRVYSAGSYEFTLVASDASGNTANCTLTFNVIDLEPPVLVPCPDDLVLQSAGSSVQGFWSEPEVSDNAGIDNVTQTHVNGDSFNVGTTIVEYIVYDLSGNTAGCTFNVTVLEAENTGSTSASSQLPIFAGAGGGGGLLVLALIVLGVYLYVSCCWHTIAKLTSNILSNLHAGTN